VSYLAVTSRLLDAPLAILVQASSAAGKSALMEAVLALVPEEQRAVLGHDRAVALLDRRKRSETQGSRHRGRGRRCAPPTR
jgi:hypothetical protein